MLPQDKAVYLAKVVNDRVESCLQEFMDLTGVPLVDFVSRGKIEYWPDACRVFKYRGEEVFRVFLDAHLAVITIWVLKPRTVTGCPYTYEQLREAGWTHAQMRQVGWLEVPQCY